MGKSGNSFLFEYLASLKSPKRNMAQNSIPGSLFSYPILCLFALFSSLVGHSNSLDQLGAYSSYTISSFRYPKTQIRPFDLRYIRVDLPPWFASMSVAVESDVHLDLDSVGNSPDSDQPMICLREGSPPLPDISNTSTKGLVFRPLSNVSEGIQAPQSTEICYPMQKNITVKLTIDQIAPGVWYFGLFNGNGPTRTQSKMIVRGPSYSFSANISVEGCTISTMQGQFCNQSVEQLSCSQSGGYSSARNISEADFYNQTIESVASCRNGFVNSCQGEGEMKVNSLEILDIAEKLTIMADNLKISLTSLNNTGNSTEMVLMCFARLGALPSVAVHDYSGGLNTAPLVIPLPRIGRWFFSIIPFNLSTVVGGTQSNSTEVCYTLDLQKLECPLGKAGLNCISERYVLQTILRKDSAPFESYYLPDSGNVTSDGANFLLEPLLSNSSINGELNDTWTYFLLDIPYGAAGEHVHVRLTSDTKIYSEVYVRFGGLPSLDSWDFYYANKTSNSEDSLFYVLYSSSEEKIDFYILNVREGIWNFGVRCPSTTNRSLSAQTNMSVSVERCPKRCSSHGECKYGLDASGLTSYSFCSCDRNHGGFDCSIQIVSHQGHVWQSVALIASNAAAVLPAYWALRQKAFSEWVLFTSSGISSGLYHACDVGTWCVLSFGVLQFMDFWLSFMAVVSTFVYLTTIDEAFKRTIHTVVSILTALMAITKATRSSNIILVMAIGALGLLLGLLIEFSVKYRSFSFSRGLCLSMLDRQQIWQWLQNLIKTVLKRFRWVFVLAGFVALSMAAISWTMERSENYWIWHSLWHVTIYTSSFFFLCSKVVDVDNGDERPSGQNYELTRQDSLSRGLEAGRT